MAEQATNSVPTPQTQSTAQPAPVALDAKAPDAGPSPVSEKPTIEVPAESTAKVLAERLNLRRELEAAKKARAELEAEVNELRPWKERKAKAKENPDEWLQSAELTFDDLVQHKLRGGKPEPVDPNKVEIDQVKKELAELKALREQEHAQKAEAAGIAHINSVVEHVKTSLDKMPATSRFLDADEAADMAQRVLVSHFREHKVALSPAQIAERLEAYYKPLAERADRKAPQADKQSAQPAQTPEAKTSKPAPVTNSLTPPPSDATDKPKLNRQQLFEANLEKLKSGGFRSGASAAAKH